MIDARANQGPGDVVKEGCDTGLTAVNPFNGERVPVGSATLFSWLWHRCHHGRFPQHDERDFEFCTTYGIAIRAVIRPGVPAGDVPATLRGGARLKEPFGRLRVRWKIPANTQRSGGSAVAAREMGAARAGGATTSGQSGNQTFRTEDWGRLPPALLGHSDPRHPLQKCGGRSGPRDQLRCSAPTDQITVRPLALDEVPEFVNVNVPSREPRAVMRPTPWTLRRFQLVLLTATSDAKNSTGAPTDPKRSTLVPYRSSTSAASSMPFST